MKTFGVEIVIGHRATVAKVMDEHGDVLAVGEAIRVPEDEKDDTIGAYLAVGRAIEAFGRKLRKDGEGLVKQADNDRFQREMSRASKRVERVTPPFKEGALVKIVGGLGHRGKHARVSISGGQQWVLVRMLGSNKKFWRRITDLELATEPKRNLL